MRFRGEINVGDQRDSQLATESRLPPISVDVDATDLPLLLADVNHRCEVGDRIQVDCRIEEQADDSESGSAVPDTALIVTGAGFDVVDRMPRVDERGTVISVSVSAVRLRSLPDHVSAGMSILICGLNPSLNSADLRVGFGRAGNRFWPAALAAGIVGVDRDPVDALVNHGVGMTDLVKRATPRAASLTRHEYAAGLERLDTLCDWLRPSVVCMVGLAGWRAAVDRKASPGVQERSLGGSPVYVMPSTSGLNAHCSLDDLTAHLRAAAAVAG